MRSELRADARSTHQPRRSRCRQASSVEQLALPAAVVAPDQQCCPRVEAPLPVTIQQYGPLRILFDCDSIPFRTTRVIRRTARQATGGRPPARFSGNLTHRADTRRTHHSCERVRCVCRLAILKITLCNLDHLCEHLCKVVVGRGRAGHQVSFSSFFQCGGDRVVRCIADAQLLILRRATLHTNDAYSCDLNHLGLLPCSNAALPSVANDLLWKDTDERQSQLHQGCSGAGSSGLKVVHGLHTQTMCCDHLSTRVCIGGGPSSPCEARFA